jgi:large subunit ribosomal protein L22
MGKPKAERRAAESEAVARASQIRGSTQKLDLVARLIRGKDAGRALTDLSFSTRRVSDEVKKVLEAAIANAENNHQLDVDRLYVSEAYVGKSLVMKRFRARARGRVGKIVKPWANLTIVVREREETV